MHEAEYRRILDAGMGRAVVATATSTDTYCRAILDACLHYTAHDPATEGNRSGFLLRAIEATGNRSYYRNAILAALDQPAASRYDRAQHFALAARFAQRGDAVARQTMYDAFLADTPRLWNPRDGSVIGAAEIVALDGWQGFLVVAAHLGALRAAHPQMWFTDGLLLMIERRYGVGACARELIPVVRKQAQIATFVAETFAHRRRVVPMRRLLTAESQESHTPTFAQIEARITRADASVSRRVLAQWGMDATADDLDCAAASLAHEDDPARAALSAAIFARRPFPADPAPLLALARGADLIAAQAALAALAHVAHPAVRALAWELRDDPLRRVMALDLLVANYAEGDAPFIREMLDAEMPPQAWHWVGYGALRVFAAHPGAASEAALSRIYERTPCSHCRHRAVMLLSARGALPDWMASECRHDAHPGTRALGAMAGEGMLLPEIIAHVHADN